MKLPAKGLTYISKAREGLTLIELLITISIIGILSSIVVVSSLKPQKQSRDAQRKSDLKQYQTAVETFANNNNGLFPSRVSRNKVSATPPAQSLCQDLELSGCPEDPKLAPGSGWTYYTYQSDGSGNGTATAKNYILWGRLEVNSSGGYWIICSNGKTAEGTEPTPPASTAVCPLP